MMNWHKDCFARDVPTSIQLSIVRSTGWPITIDSLREMRCIEFLHLFFQNSKFRNRNSNFSIFQQRNSTKKSNRNLRNLKWNRNSASNGGPRNWNQKSEFATKIECTPPPLPVAPPLLFLLRCACMFLVGSCLLIFIVIFALDIFIVVFALSKGLVIAGALGNVPSLAYLLSSLLLRRLSSSLPLAHSS